MSFISWAQAGEDILLWRALAPRVHHDQGFYIDVGGFDPDQDSVTRAFYDCGWHGINIEPVRSFFERFLERRPRDINLPVAVSDKAGKVTFHEIVGHQLGTLVDQYAAQHSQAGFQTRAYDVEALPLREICDRYVGDRSIHFLKIDVEGHEGAVLRGMDFRRYRPWILVIEAIAPNRPDILTHEAWDEDVRSAGYIFAGTALPNRYYVAKEKSELAHYFSIEPDDYERASSWFQRDALEREVVLLRKQLEQTLAVKAAPPRPRNRLQAVLQRLADLS